jgi:tyrosyl-DNA phosphodiesterase-1
MIAIYVQDFPLKTTPGTTSVFEHDLLLYFSSYKNKIDVSALSMYDFSIAKVTLIPHVPGYHNSAVMNQYGHLKMRATLRRETLSKRWWKTPIIAQFSSMGSLNENVNQTN